MRNPLPAWLVGDPGPIPGLVPFLRVVALAALCVGGLLVASLATCSGHRDAELARLQQAIEDQGRADVQNALHVHEGLVRRDALVQQERAAGAVADTAAAHLAITRAAAQRATAPIHVQALGPAAAPDPAAGDTAARVAVTRDGDAVRYQAPKFLTDAMAALRAAADSAFAAQLAEHDARVRAEAVIAHDSLGVIPRFQAQVAGLQHDVALRDTVIATERPPRCGRRCGVIIGIAGTIATGVVLNKVWSVARLLVHAR